MGEVIHVIIHYVGGVPFGDELYHYGILGQKWGIRRYQNPDGTLTPAGKARYGTEIERMAAKDAQRVSDARASYGEGAGVRRRLLSKEINKKLENKAYRKAYEEAEKHVDTSKSLKRAEKLHKKSGTFVKGRSLADSGYKHSKNALKTAGSVALTALVGAAQYSYFRKNGNKFVADILLAGYGAVALGTIAKSSRNAYSYQYYEKNKKF